MKKNNEFIEALESAKIIIEPCLLSKNDLYHTLKSENYSEEAIQYALNNINVNYFNNAVESIKFYNETYPEMTKEELYEQLIHDEFTLEESQYAVDQLFN